MMVSWGKYWVLRLSLFGQALAWQLAMRDPVVVPHWQVMRADVANVGTRLASRRVFSRARPMWVACKIHGSTELVDTALAIADHMGEIDGERPARADLILPPSRDDSHEISDPSLLVSSPRCPFAFSHLPRRPPPQHWRLIGWGQIRRGNKIEIQGS